MRINKFALVALLAIFSVHAYAEDKAEPSKSGRSKQLHFEDSVVEGLNQNSKDSLETIGKKDFADRPHLYKKRQHYQPEIRQLSRELGHLP